MTDTLTRLHGSDGPTDLEQLDPDFIPGATLYEVADSGQQPSAPIVESKPVHKFQLVDPNQHWFIVLCLIIFGAILAASILWSFNAIVAMSEWMAPSPQLRWLPAVFLDLAIIGYSLTLAAFKARGVDGKKKLWMTRMGLIISTSFSVIANATHTLDFWKGDLSTYQAQIGIVFSAIIPLLALMATEEIVRLAFALPDDNEDAKAAKPRAGKRD